MFKLSINEIKKWTVDSHSKRIYNQIKNPSNINHIKITYVKKIYNYTFLVKFQKLVIYIYWYYIHYSYYKI